MIWRNNGGLRCPKCGGAMDPMIEMEYEGNGGRRVRHVMRCKYCGHRMVLQEVIIRRTPQGLIKVSRIT